MAHLVHVCTSLPLGTIDGATPNPPVRTRVDIISVVMTVLYALHAHADTCNWQQNVRYAPAYRFRIQQQLNTPPLTHSTRAVTNGCGNT